MTDTPRKIHKTGEEWQDQLTSEQYRITRMKGTERPFSGEYYANKEEGVYRCVACGTPLFASDAKYDSGTGWPSFWEPLDEANVETEEDRSLFMRRIEVHCAVCGAHQGHVFEDGPALRASATASTPPHSASIQKPNQSNFLASHIAPYRLVGGDFVFSYPYSKAGVL